MFNANIIEGIFQECFGMNTVKLNQSLWIDIASFEYEENK